MDEDRKNIIMDLSQLRNLIRQYVDNHMYKSAAFWADKVCSLSQDLTQDILWHAHTLFLTRQFTRAANVLKSRGLLSVNANARYLAAKCHYECKDWHSALQILEGEYKEPFFVRSASTDRECKMNLRCIDGSSDGSLVGCGGRKIECATSLLKGQLYLALDNKDLAVTCFREALMRDVYCYEAFDLLVAHHSLMRDEEINLINSMPFNEQCSAQEADLVRVVYEARIQKYAKPTEARLPSHLGHLEENLDYMACIAERHLNACAYSEALHFTTACLRKDAMHEASLPLHVACLVQLKRSNELYELAMRLVDVYPERAISWYAIGAYYLLINKNEAARKHFSKATSLDALYGPAWLGFAHSFAIEGEHDQAISAYFSAAKLMPGSHLPYLYLGLEYSLSNNLKLSMRFYREAQALAPDDPHIKHELGSLCYANGEYGQARTLLTEAATRLETIDSPEQLSCTWEPLLNNLGHVCRKLKDYPAALGYHRRALAMQPLHAGTHAAIGMCELMLNRHDAAVRSFHKSLSLKRDDTVVTQLLARALEPLANLNLSIDPDEAVEEEEELDLTSQNETSLHGSSCSNSEVTGVTNDDGNSHGLDSLVDERTFDDSSVAMSMVDSDVSTNMSMEMSGMSTPS